MPVCQKKDRGNGTEFSCVLAQASGLLPRNLASGAPRGPITERRSTPTSDPE